MQVLSGSLFCLFLLSYLADVGKSSKCIFNFGDTDSHFPYSIIGRNDIPVTIHDENSYTYTGGNPQECDSFDQSLIPGRSTWFYPENTDAGANGCCIWQRIFCQSSRKNEETVMEYSNRVQTTCSAILGYPTSIVCRFDASSQRNYINKIQIRSVLNEIRPDSVKKYGCEQGMKYYFPDGQIIGDDPSGLFYISVLGREFLYLPTIQG